MLRDVTGIRYVTPLREGGSVPGVVEADDLGTYVVKFSGAAQGRKALVAEVIAGELGRRLGLRVPELVRFDFDRPLRRNQVHDFALRSWVTADPEPATAVSTTFTIPAREASIHLHFHGPEKPSSFWEYRVDPADPTEPGGIDEFTPPSNPDDAAWRYVDAKGSISLVLREPTIGVEYGLSWAW